MSGPPAPINPHILIKKTCISASVPYVISSFQPVLFTVCIACSIKWQGRSWLANPHHSNSKYILSSPPETCVDIDIRNKKYTEVHREHFNSQDCFFLAFSLHIFLHRTAKITLAWWEKSYETRQLIIISVSVLTGKGFCYQSSAASIPTSTLCKKAAQLRLQS